MHVVYERCAGLDVHKRTVVACANTPDADGQRHKERRTFSTMTADVLTLRDWLKGLGVTHVAMESTGVFWKPIYNLLEGHARAAGGQCPAYQSRRWSQDRPQRRRVDCRSLAAWEARVPALFPRHSCGNCVSSRGIERV